MKRYIFLTLTIVSLCFLFQIQISIAASANKPSTKVKKTLSPKSITADKIILKPDLTVTTFSVFPSNPKYMEPITMYMMVKNIGKGDAKDSFEIKLYYVKYGNIHVVKLKNLNIGLGAGKEYVLQGSFVPKFSTSYKLVAMVDVKDEVAELREGNNSKVKDISIVQEHKPDLIVSRFNMSPPSPKVGGNYTYWVFVKNIGQGKSKRCILSNSSAHGSSPPASFDPYGWSSRMVPALYPGQEWRYMSGLLSGLPQPGFKIWRFIIDKANTLSETNENNNTLDITFEVIN